MLDDGRLRVYDIEDFRTRLCAHIAKLQHENDFPSKCIEIFYLKNIPAERLDNVIFLLFVFAVPAVTIVVEGGKDTITNMYYDLRANIPVVIIDVSK